MNNNRGSENRRYLHGTRARQADRESFIALLINQCYNSLVAAMDIHDEVTAQYILRMSEDELRAICLVSDRFPHSGGGGLWYPENLRFARALRSIEHLALFMDVHAIVERWDWGTRNNLFPPANRCARYRENVPLYIQHWSAYPGHPIACPRR